MNTEEKLAEILHAPYETMASPYVRITEMIDFVEGYFLMNIDDTAGNALGEMTINELRAVLVPKINHYSKFVATDKPGVFRKQDELEKWLKDGFERNKSN